MTKSSYANKKFHTIMKEYSNGTLHIGTSSKKVKSSAQAKAIAESYIRKHNNKKK